MRKKTTKRIHYTVYWLSILTMLLLPHWCTSQSNYIFDINHLSVEDGLPDRFVVKINQGNDGFIWMNTPGYLCRYDGYQIKSYQNSLFNARDDEYIGFDIDPNNHFWSHKQKDDIDNVLIFDPKTEVVTPLEVYFKDTLPFVSSDIQYTHSQKHGENSLLWIYLKNGTLYNYDGYSIKKIVILPSQNKSYFSQPLFFKNHIWVVNNSFAFKYSTDWKLLKRISLPKKNPLLPKNSNFIPKIFNDKLHIINRAEGNNNAVYVMENDSLLLIPQLSNNNRKLLCAVSSTQKNDLIWFVQNKTIVAYNKEYEEVFKHKLKSVINVQSFLSVHSIFLDKQENVWIGTTEGVYKISIRKNPFHQFFNGASTRGIYVFEDSMWVASYRKDRLIDLNSGQAKKGFFQSTDILGISPSLDSTKLLICEAPQFFHTLDIKTKEKKTFNNYSIDALHCSIETFNSKIIIIGKSKGLTTLDLDNQKLKPFITDNSILNNARIYHLYQNKKGVWIASNKGIFLINEQGKVIEHFDDKKGFPSNSYIYIHEDKEGIFWLGSSNSGLVEWNQSEETIKVYDKKSGLFNETIYAVIEDKFGYLWLPSDYGLVRFNKKTKIANTYLTRDGLPHVEFNLFSYFQNRKTDDIFFGGLNGVIQFNPKEFLRDTIFDMPIHITSYKVLKGNDNELSDLTASLNNEENQIVIRPGDKFFELRFSLMDYIDNEQNKYAYQIEGYDKNWHFIKENFIRITNLPYGNYTLKIKGQGNKGQWSSDILSIKVVSKAPFYWTWWFILIIVGLLSLAVFSWSKWRTYALKKDKQRLEQEVNRRTAIIQEQTEALKALDKSKSRFFSNITHEFRTPLTLIIGPVEQMLERVNSNWMTEQLQLVQRNTQQLFGLINQLLDVSKMESGKMNLVLSSGDLNLFLKDSTNTFQSLAQKKQIELHYQSDFNEFLTDFDTDKIQKIINNLLSNAIKYTPSNGQIFMKFKKNTAESIQITVSDNGQGIAKDHQKRVFERFFQADDSSTRQSEGTGIGLALVKELVDLMNGSIELNSELGVGSTFKIILPLSQNAKREVIEISPISIQNSSSSSKSSSLIILIVEDNLDMRNFIKSCLTDSRYQILEAENGQKGTEVAFEEIPDLIISDVMMPIKNGFELVEDVRNNIKTSHIPIILLTAKTAIESKIKGFQMGVDAYLYKPFNSLELNARINNLIELRKELQDKYQANNIETVNIITDSNDKKSQKENVFITKLQTLIVAELQNTELNGAYLGHQIGMSRMQLHRKIKALTNQSIGEFIRQIRLNKAMELLQSSGYNVAETAYETGFTSPSQLSRNFKNHFGFPPSKVKK